MTLTSSDALASGPRPRVLVVDDAPTVRAYHGSILAAAGFDVDEAANGLEALEQTMLHAYDLLVVDVNMPQMDGFTLVTRLRSVDVDDDTPVVMISTQAHDRDAVAAYGAGANLFLTKPVDPAVLTRVAQVLTTPLRDASEIAASSLPLAAAGGRS